MSGRGKGGKGLAMASQWLGNKRPQEQMEDDYDSEATITDDEMPIATAYLLKTGKKIANKKAKIDNLTITTQGSQLAANSAPVSVTPVVQPNPKGNEPTNIGPPVRTVDKIKLGNAEVNIRAAIRMIDADGNPRGLSQALSEARSMLEMARETLNLIRSSY